MHLNAPGLEQARHDVCRAMGFKTELGMGVDIATNAGQLRMVGAHSLERGAEDIGHDGSYFEQGSSSKPRIAG